MGNVDFSKTMGRLPDEELLRIVSLSDADEYVPEAVDAAKKELGKRGIADDEQVTASNQQSLDLPEKHLIALSDKALVLFILFGGILGISLPIAAYLVIKGYNKKAKEAFFASMFSIVAWLVILAIYGTLMS